MNLLNYHFMKIFLLASVIGMFCFFKTSQTLPVKSISPAAYKEQVKQGDVLVDVRTPAEFKAGHVKKALNSDFNGGQFAEQIKGWDKSKTYYLYCASGNRSGKAAKLMSEAGFKHIFDLGAYKDLKAGGLPVSQEK